MNHGQMDEYIRRVNLACDYIDAHIASMLTLEELAAVAGFSEYHFHRIFAAMTGRRCFALSRGCCASSAPRDAAVRAPRAERHGGVDGVRLFVARGVLPPV